MTTDSSKIPKFFLRLDNIKAIKDAVKEEMDGPITPTGAGLIHNSSLGVKRQAESDIGQIIK